MEMTGLQIFKYMPAAKKLPQSNCKECGCPTCMVYSLKLAKQQREIDKCPYVCEELRQNYCQSLKHPQNTVEIGDLKIGGENVLYRHEKTFINPTTIAVMVDCSKPDYEQKLKEINEFEYTHVGENFRVDLVILKNNYHCDESEKRNGSTPHPTPQPYGIQAHATHKFVGSLCIPMGEGAVVCEFMSNTNAGEGRVVISFDKLQSLGLNIIEEQDFQTTKDYLIETRRRAILDKDENSSAPVCVVMKNDDIYSQCARASYYLCKYANMLIFDEFDKDLFSTLITLRHNIFTDPQKTLQVDSGLYKYNNPDENSIIFMTTNFALTYFAVANELENLDVPTYLIIVPADGMSVLTAWSAQTFTPEIVSKFLDELDIKNKIKTRKIIIPGLVSDMIEELNAQCPDFEFIEGTKDASDIGEFVKKLQ